MCVCVCVCVCVCLNPHKMLRWPIISERGSPIPLCKKIREVPKLRLKLNCWLQIETGSNLFLILTENKAWHFIRRRKFEWNDKPYRMWKVGQKYHSFSFDNITYTECQGRACIPGTEAIKLFSCSTQLSVKFSLLIHMKMPTIVGIFIFINREMFMLSYV